MVNVTVLSSVKRNRRVVNFDQSSQAHRHLLTWACACRSRERVSLYGDSRRGRVGQHHA
jgi:hypothetical protein